MPDRTDVPTGPDEGGDGLGGPSTALWVVPVPEIGGVARHVLDVAEVGLPGWRLVVLCPEGALAERLRDLGAAVVTGPFGPEAGVVASVRTLRRVVRTLRPSVVHSHLAYADVVATLATAGLTVTLATTEHGIADDDLVYHGSVWKSAVRARLHRLRLRRADLVLAVSRATRRAMERKWRPRQAITVIPNGVDVAEVRARVGDRGDRTAGDGPRVLSLSRLSAEKRIPELLDAFRVVLRSRPAATLTVAGSGPDRAALEARVAELGLTGRVSLPGFVDAGRAMSAADVVVQLSVWENCSYTLLDACAAGLGVVATPVGGNPEILGPDSLVPADDPEAVAAAVMAAADHPRTDFTWLTRAEMTSRIVAAYGSVRSDGAG